MTTREKTRLARKLQAQFATFYGICLYFDRKKFVTMFQSNVDIKISSYCTESTESTEIWYEF